MKCPQCGYEKITPPTERDCEIFAKFRSGVGTEKLADEYYLTQTRIQQIIRKAKKLEQHEPFRAD